MQPSKPRSPRTPRRRIAFVALAAMLSLLVAMAVAGTTVAVAKTNCTASDPDGGVVNEDKPQGGGDCNNGSGNDVDCEDDNNGQGIPGHCKKDACPDETLNPGKQPVGTVCKVAGSGDACPNQTLNPGTQVAGTICKVAGSGDACPNQTLNPGTQVAGTVCKVAGSGDACPNQTLNPGTQVAGTICKVAGSPGSSDTVTGGDGPTGVDVAGPAVQGSGAAPNTPSDRTVVAGANAGPTTAPAATDAGGDYAVVSTGGSLPVTGAPIWVASIVGLVALMLGSLAYRDARRVSRTREVGAAA